jgi:hypothetical protein
VVQENGNWYRAIRPVTAHNLDPAKIFTYWELNYVRANTTLLIGSQETFATFAEAWNYAYNAKISDAVYLHFYISSFHASFTQNFTGNFSLDHGEGHAITILGDSPNSVVFNFKSSNQNAPGVGGLVIDGGNTIACIEGIQVVGASPCIGLLANDGGTIGLLQNMIFNGFSVGVQAQMNAAIVGLSNCTFEAAATAALVAQMGGNVSCSNFSFNGAAMQNSPANYGVLAQYGGTVSIVNAHISACGVGIEAEYGGIVDAEFGAVNGCSFGAAAAFHATIDLSTCDVYDNSTVDLQAAQAGIIDALGGMFTTESVGTNDGSYIYGTGQVV